MLYFRSVHPRNWPNPQGPSCRQSIVVTDTARRRVLVVEDEPLVAMVIEDAIGELGQDVVGPIAEFHEALALVADGELCCAILDINVRGGNSYPVADILSRRGVPVLLMSG